MQIIADKAMQETLAKLYGQLADEDIILVDLESIYHQSQLRQDVGGLAETLKVAKTSKPVIMLGWQDPLAYSSKPEWHGAMGYPNVTFVRHPATPEDVEYAVALIRQGAWPVDALAIKLLDVESPNNSLQVLHHDLGHAERDETYKAAWLTRARKHFGDHSDEELFRLVQNKQQPEIGPLTGQSFPDVCVDVEGTLIDQHGNLREEVIAKVQYLSEDRPVTIWTGGDMREMSATIRKLGLAWKLASKNSLRGAKVYAIIDDLDQDKFSLTYNVACDIYIKV